MTKKAPVLYWLLISWLIIVIFWWGFAFLPIPTISAETINKARQVCFGFMDNGLPAPYGWMLLIGAPLMVLAMIFVLWGDEKKELMPRTPAGLKIFSLIILLFFILEAVVIGKKIDSQIKIPVTASDFPAVEDSITNYSRLNSIAPTFELTDQSGKKISFSSSKGKIIFLTFVYAHCQTMCPALKHDVEKAYKEIGPEKSTIYFVTLDPWRDTPSSLPTLFKNWELPEGSHILSGLPEEVTKVLDDYQVPRARDNQSGEISHPAIVYLIDQSGKIAYLFNHPSSKLLSSAAEIVMKSQ